MRWTQFLALLVIACGCMRCVPQTAIRRTALVPAAYAPTSLGRPLARGEVRLAASASTSQEVALNSLNATLAAFPNEGDPGLLLPRYTLGATAYVGLARYVEAGLGMRYTRASWAKPNAFGVQGFRRQDPYALGLSWGLRTHYRRNKSPLSLSLSAEAHWDGIPQAVYTCSRSSNGACRYSQASFSTQNQLSPAGFVHVGYDVRESLHLSAFAGLEAGIKNNGFDPNLRTVGDSTLKWYPVGILGASVEAQWQRFFVNGALYVPVENEERIALHLGANLQTGVRF